MVKQRDMSPVPEKGDTPTENKYRFLLLYGSATGQAQAIAEEIAEKAPGFGLLPELYPLDETGKRFNIEHEACIVIVTSTTGDGDPPANAEKFMRRIKKRTLSSDYLSHLQYALLGLGDTNYSSFCRCAKDMDGRLQALGAKHFYPAGFADDGVGLEVVAEPWLDGLYPALQKFLGVNGESTVASITERVKSVTISSSSNGEHSSEDGDKNILNTSSTLTDSTVLNNKLKSANSSNSNENEKEKNHTDISGVNGDSNQTQTEATGTQKEISESVDLVDQMTFFNNQRQIETPCKPIDLSQTTQLSCALTSLSDDLSEKTLTVPVLPPDFLKVTFSHQVVMLKGLSHQNGLKLPLAASPVLKARVSEAKVLTQPQAVKRTLLLSLDIEDSDTSYRPGDSISVICPNNCSEVDLLLERLKMTEQADLCMSLSVIPDTKKRRAAVPPHIHDVTTLRYVLVNCCNIRESPSKAMIRALAEHTTDTTELRRMQELCSKEGAQIYTQVIREKHISLLDFLYAFPSCTPPVERILEHLPRLQPRPYSACSCPLVDKSRVDVVFNVVEVEADTASGHLYQRRGVCTGWLDDLTTPSGAGDARPAVEVPVYLRTNQHFRPPDDLSLPIIMVGPGTGVAPFVGFLKERSFLRQQAQASGQSYGETWLFYGCRNKELDFLFREDLEGYEASKVLSHLCVTFSRDDEPSADRVDAPSLRYVQDFLRHKSHDIARLLVEEQAAVFVCGDATGMAKDVTLAFEDILIGEKGFSRDEANMFVMKKRLHKTYFEDVWT